MEREINAKGELLLEVQHSLQKLKVRNQDAEAELEERTRELDTVSKALEHQVSKPSILRPFFNTHTPYSVL